MAESSGAVGKSEDLVPLHLDGHTVYLAAVNRAQVPGGDEVEVVARQPNVDDALRGLSAFAEKVAASLDTTGVTRLSVEFNCEFAVESGTLVAIVGKASGTTGVKVGLEWEKPPN